MIVVRSSIITKQYEGIPEDFIQLSGQVNQSSSKAVTVKRKEMRPRKMKEINLVALMKIAQMLRQTSTHSLKSCQATTSTYRERDGIELKSYLKTIGGIGVATNYEAECTAIIEGLNMAIQQGWQHIWVHTDSVAAAKAFQADKVLWKLRAQWDKIKHSCIWLHFTSSFAADTSANKGVQLNKGSKQWWNHKPPFLKKIENPDLTYYRFIS
ncbi:hypothetical protein IFM89_033661 [Coptis chinensis]|uniref:RNase H type-1 domain-containing protein n=1 Tax=Coptis chinensis TaxID=261450 RepID=A0A835HGM9_9MAGN|nr:hypothetical protein IFM89_033661 [Coptis chinensis]